MEFLILITIPKRVWSRPALFGEYISSGTNQSAYFKPHSYCARFKYISSANVTCIEQIRVPEWISISTKVEAKDISLSVYCDGVKTVLTAQKQGLLYLRVVLRP